MTELELHRGATLSEQMNFARLVADGSILPDAYRRNPSNVLIAVGLGQSMGLSPAESLYRIAVIKGKPTAGAELIAANVRRAGHKLRVITNEQAVSVKAVIIRADDPDFPHEVVRDMAWAQSMGLDKNDNYRKQPLTMLQWRAITAVARLAAPEALYGVAYTADEMFDSNGGPAEPERPATLTAEQVVEHDRLMDLADAAAAPNGMDGPAMAEVEADLVADPLLDTSSKLARAMFAGINAAGIEDPKAFMSEVVGRTITSSKELTTDDARRVLDHLPKQEASA
jgi:hypothetical protein